MNDINQDEIDITIIDRIYRREDANELPEHIKANLKPVISALSADYHRWPKRKETLFVIRDDEQQRLARWYPLGKQDEVMRSYIDNHGFLSGCGWLAHVDTNASVDRPMVSASELLPLTTFANGVAATIKRDIYPCKLLLGDYVTESDVGALHIPDNISDTINQIRQRNVNPVFMTDWRDRDAGIVISDKLQRVRLAARPCTWSTDTLNVLSGSCCADGLIHPLGYALVKDARWKNSRAEVKVSEQGNWLPVITDSLQTETLVEEIRCTGYVRWDISDLGPQQTKENRNHVNESDSKE